MLVCMLMMYRRLGYRDMELMHRSCDDRAVDVFASLRHEVVLINSYII